MFSQKNAKNYGLSVLIRYACMHASVRPEQTCVFKRRNLTKKDINQLQLYKEIVHNFIKKNGIMLHFK